MGIMKAWEKWSQKQYDGWGRLLQNKYDKYRNTKTPEWYLALTDKLWNVLDDSTKRILNNLVRDLIARYNDTFAKKVTGKVVAELRDIYGE